MRKIITTIALAAVFIGLPLTSQAMPMLEIENNRLVGAKHVQVGWRFFDVEFIDGSCIGLFNGCDSSDDFAFNTLASAQQALTSLLNTVLIGPVDLAPFLVRGCNDPQVCNIITPFGFPTITDSNAPLAVLAAGVLNFNPSLNGGLDRVIPVALTGFRADPTDNSPNAQVTTFARFSEVPEPSSLALFALAFAGLGLARRKIAK